MRKRDLLGDVAGFIVLFPLILIAVMWDRWRSSRNSAIAWDKWRKVNKKSGGTMVLGNWLYVVAGDQLYRIKVVGVKGDKWE